MLSFRTERNGVKNLGNVHVNINFYVTEILRFALNDKTDATYFLHVTKKKPSVVSGRLVVVYAVKFKKSLSSHETSLPAEYKKPQNDYIHRGA